MACANHKNQQFPVPDLCQNTAVSHTIPPLTATVATVSGLPFPMHPRILAALQIFPNPSQNQSRRGFMPRRP